MAGERVIAGRRPRYVYDDEAPPPPIPEPSTRTASGLGLVIGREVDLAPLPMQVETKKGLVEKPSPPKLVSVFLAQRRDRYCDARRRGSVHFVDAQRHPEGVVKSDGVFTHAGGQHLRRRF